MGTTRFFPTSSNRSALSATGYAVVLNGTGGGAPALVEEAQYPMLNITNPDRYTPWTSPMGTSPATITLDLDLGPATPVPSALLAGVFGVRVYDAAFDIGVKLERQVAYSPGGTWTAVSTTYSAGILGARDIGITNPSAAARYWRWTFTNVPTKGISVGMSHIGGTGAVDLGIVYSPGATIRHVNPTITSRNGAGHLRSFAVGDTYRLVSMPFQGITDAMRANIELAFGPKADRTPAVWVDHADVASQVVLSSEGISWTHNWYNPNSWDCDVELEVLG